MEIDTYYKIEYTDYSNTTTVLKESANTLEFDKILDILRRLKIKGDLHLVLYGFIVDKFLDTLEGTDKLLCEVRTEII